MSHGGPLAYIAFAARGVLLGLFSPHVAPYSPDCHPSRRVRSLTLKRSCTLSYTFCTCSQEEHPHSSTIHATFNKRVGQLAEASEEYHREGVAFLRGLLDSNPDTRMTAEQALEHPFLAGHFPDVPPDLIPTLVKEPPPVLKNTMDRMLWEACVRIAKQKAKRKA
jgi:hypothetical protein